MPLRSFLHRLFGRPAAVDRNASVAAEPRAKEALKTTEETPVSKKLHSEVKGASIAFKLGSTVTETQFKELDVESETDRIFRECMDEVAAVDGCTWLHATIAGLTHCNKDGTSRMRFALRLKTLDRLNLVRELENEHSTSAVAVYDKNGHQLGYVPEWLSRDVAKALDSGGVAEAFVKHIRQTGATTYAAAIAVMWRVQNSPRTEFRVALDRRGDVEEWFWAKLSKAKGRTEQAAICSLKLNDELVVIDSFDGVWLVTLAAEPIACLTKQQAEIVRAGIADNRIYEARVFEVRERSGTQDMEPVVAVMLLKDRH